MNCFIIKASFTSTANLEMAKNYLIDTGVEIENINYNFKFETGPKQKSFQLKLVALFAVLGTAIYYISLSNATSLDSLGTLLSTDILKLLSFISIFSLIGLATAYILEKNKILSNDQIVTLVVTTPYERIQTIKKNLERFEISHMTILDEHAEIEAGFRAQ